MTDWLGLVVVGGIFLVMAGFSCTIDIKKFISYLKKPKGILIGLFCQYGLLPLSAYFISSILNLSSVQSIAFIITGSCPGGTLSNFFCWFFGANLELSIAMTTASSVLSFAFLSINCIIYMPLVTDENVHIDYISLAISVSSLICGVIFGLFIAYKTKPSIDHNVLETFCIKIQIKKSLIIIGGIAMIVTLLLGAYENTLVSSVPAYRLPFQVFIAGLILNATSWTITFIISYFICHLPNNQTITVCIECANQNVGLSIAIILLTMDRHEADIAVGIPMFYGVLNSIVIFTFGTIARLSGFIQNNDDEINHKYENSGFSKLCQFLHGDKTNNNNNEKSVQNKTNPDDGTHRKLTVPSHSQTACTPEPNDSNIEMLIEEYEMARTPSNEEIAVKQSLKQNESNNGYSTKHTKQPKHGGDPEMTKMTIMTPFSDDDEGDQLNITTSTSSSCS